MNRKMKLLINSLIIFCFFFGIYYTQGIYVSMKECVDDYLRSMYIEDNHIITSFECNNRVAVLCSDDENKYLRLVYLDCFTPFYKSNSIIDELIDPDKNASLINDDNKDIGFISLVYRTNKDIAYVKYTFGGKDEFICEQWYGNYTYLNYPDYNYLKYAFYDKYPIFKCEAFDSNGNLIDVIH